MRPYFLDITLLHQFEQAYWRALYTFYTALRGPAGFSVIVCSACNLASPIVSGILFEILTGRQPMSRYPFFLGIMATLYTIEPLLTRVYIKNVCIAGEKVCHIQVTIESKSRGMGSARLPSGRESLQCSRPG